MSKKPIEETKKPTPHVRTVEYNIEEVTQSDVGGFTLGFCGFPNTGKTMTAIMFGNLRKELVPQFEDQYPKTAEALMNGDIPEVREIWIIDSENGAKKQINREKKLLQNIRGKIPIKVIHIPEVSVDYSIDLENKTVEYTTQCIEEIEDALWLYNKVIDDFAEQTDGNALLLIDSCSRFKKLVDIKSGITFNMSIEEKGEEAVKQMGYSRWGDRNAMWEKTMTKIRGVPGWVICTFKTQVNKDWVLSMLRKKGKQPDETKTIMLDSTPHNMDMMYDFDFPENNFSINIETRVGRYVNRNVNDANKFEINTKDRFSSLQLIEHLIEELMSDDFIN